MVCLRLKIPSGADANPISLGRFNRKASLSNQHQQILIAADEYVGASALCQIEKHLVLQVSAHNRARFDLIDRLAIGKIVTQQLQTLVRVQLKLRVREDSREFGGSSPR
jgi:hypothetical protein